MVTRYLLLSLFIDAKDHSTSKGPHERAIVHIDIDCFHAQVEMIKDPELKTKPLGIKQKNLVVTCNYVARELGVQKVMCIKEAIQICPQIVLVCGEDLTDYREASYKVTRILEEFSPLVERLGFDENFIDVTSLVHSHQRTDIIGNGAESLISGHIYLEGSGALPEPCSCGCYSRLQEASHIAQEIRNRIYQELGLTTCAGIAHNKLLAKLVCGSHKPNQQTTLFPQHVGHLLKSLNTVKDIPGIGSAMYKNLSEMNINLVGGLQLCDLSSLEETVGSDQARRLKNLSFGVDETPVVLSGKPQSHSLEDTFRKCSTVSECRQRLGLLLQRLIKRSTYDSSSLQSIQLVSVTPYLFLPVMCLQLLVAHLMTFRHLRICCNICYDESGAVCKSFF
ncbi:DNA polymerase iota-like isoform X2 [Tachypleus tridentatus]|uniref:DNA polymerase iota-like isoform X2 n=1 Tax=Tachypleus tridentatus TaxID=6853 RepID=UPI003FD417CD